MPQKTKGLSGVRIGSDYSTEESAFLRAIARYKQDHHKNHLDCTEVLAIARSIGYRKVVPNSPLPKFH